MADTQISTWTRFHSSASTPLDLSIFKPLQAVETRFDDPAFYGPVLESPGEYMLIIDWKSAKAYEDFKTSPHYQQLLANFKAQSTTEPTTQMVNFGKLAFAWHFGLSTEVRTVYFPLTMSVQQREAVGNLSGLVLSMTPGIGASSSHLPYNGVPVAGWVEGAQKWNGNNLLACVWCHYWADKEAEERFKNEERRPPRGTDPVRRLAVEAFDLDLKELGAVGWTDYHLELKELDFEEVSAARRGTT
ncbi:hypothetical protein B0J13DRAFT_159322 [Dactylonectria estremocensis]|uniref:ABM domain-containing protein n=1 Tax=Dactylonectria estremocensis TaxID=1079267 RepID=A0A9P9DM70_9HYPO|nr:hypothetical protein B0J13DRAFT_159322 [Dactylonectria estremocensis]